MVMGLSRLEHAWSSQQLLLRRNAERDEIDAARMSAELGVLQQARDVRKSTKGDAFFLRTPRGDVITDRTVAGTGIHKALSAAWITLRLPGDQALVELGELGNFNVVGVARRNGEAVEARLALRMPNGAEVPGSSARVLADVPPLGLVSRLENRVEGIETTLEQHGRSVQAAHSHRRELLSQLGKSFEQRDALDRLRDELARLQESIRATSADSLEVSSEGPPADPSAALREPQHPAPRGPYAAPIGAAATTPSYGVRRGAAPGL